ncbi:MAG: C4-type zinc ribbon domain-containing protein [Dehalococcoidia bacterium]
MPALREMFSLQAVDLEVDQRKQRLEEIARKLGNERPLAKYRNEAKALRESLHRITARRRELDGISNDFGARIEAAESKLYGGTVSSSRELQDLQSDIEQLKRQRSTSDSALLEVMEQMDAEQEKSTAAEKQLAKAERVWKDEQERMAAEREVLQRELAEFEKDRDVKAGVIPPAELSLYEQVRKGHGGKAVAQVRNGICQGCRVALPTRQVSTIKSSATPVRCPSCGLILLPD